MLKIYRYFFFKMYLWNLNAFGKEELPIVNALLQISLLTILNFITTVLIVEVILKIVVIDFSKFATPAMVLISILILSMNYFVLIYKGNAKATIHQYSDKSDFETEKGDSQLTWYIGGTLLASLLALIFRFSE